MANWQLLYSVDGVDSDIEGAGRNVTGTCLTSATKIALSADHQQDSMAGVYKFTVQAGAATVICEEGDSMLDKKNPLLFAGARSIVGDGATPNLNLIPGWSIIIDTPVEDDVFEIGIGCVYSTYQSAWIRATALGFGLPGLNGEAVTLKAKNTFGYDMASCALYAVNAARAANASALAYIRPFSIFRQWGILNPDADADLNGKAVTFANRAAGTPPLIDILVDGEHLDVVDISTGATVSGGYQIECDPESVYRFADATKYRGVEFSLATATANTDTATIYVSDGGAIAEIATMTGDFVSGPTGISLTEDGQTEGTVPNNATAYFRLRAAPSSATTTALNMRSFNLMAIGYTV